MAGKTKVLHCAIYTRKSSDGGLEQDFNSLDAQREAGEAFVLSQKHEGWAVLAGRYDDGGISGGTGRRYNGSSTTSRREGSMSSWSTRSIG